MNYRPEIDGLRALAVLPVIFFHAGFETFSGGFVGVDVFFVISGYLITTIIISEMAEDKFSLVNFYERRARRILPALFFVMAVCLPLAWYSLSSAALQDFGQSLVAVATFSSNFLFWQENTYFVAASELKPLLHTWSLAVEEQYYIIFPALLMLTWRLGVQQVITILAFVFLVSLGLAVWETQYNINRLWPPGGAYFLLPTRLWELLIGTFLAFYLHHHTYLKSHSVNQVLSIVGIAMIVYSVVGYKNHTPFPGLSALIPTLGTALLILCAVPQTIANKLLSAKFLVGVGLISYSAYLWHQPLLAFARHRVLGEVSDTVLILLCSLSLGLAWLSWKYVEHPFRGKSSKVSRKQVFQFSVGGMLIFTALGLLLHFNNGFTEYKYKQVDEKLMSIGVKNFEHDNGDLQIDSWSILRKVYNDSSYPLGNPDVHKKNNFDLASTKKRVLLVGNSHSKDLFNVFYHSNEISKILDVEHYSAQLHHIDARFYSSEAYSASDVVVLAFGYRGVDLALLYDATKQIISDQKQVVVVAEVFNFLKKGRATLADHVIEIELKKGVSSLEELKGKVNAAYSEHYSNDITTSEFLSRREGWVEVKKRIEADFPAVVFLSKMDYICPNSYCHGLTDTGNKTFPDGVHHTLAGAKFFGKLLSATKFYDDLITGLGLSDQNPTGSE